MIFVLFLASFLALSNAVELRIPETTVRLAAELSEIGAVYVPNIQAVQIVYFTPN
jgi:hypothetical protein